jgi:ERCC4-type nuclease
MKLVIDYREKKLIGLLNSVKLMNAKYKPIEILVENLPLSDVIIKDDKNNEKLLIERKTINDLASSIQDGRYNEQSYRLTNCDIHNHNIMYLIEGNISMWNNKYTRIDRDTIYSAIFSIMYYKGFTTFITSTTVETAEFLLNTALKIHKNEKQSSKKQPYYTNQMDVLSYNINKTLNDFDNKSQQENQVSDPSLNKLNIQLNPSALKMIEDTSSPAEKTPDLKYTKYVKREKKSNITPENIDVIMLSQIPNVSVDTAIQIINKYKTIYNLINVLSKNASELKEFKVKTKSGERRLNSNVISYIKKYIVHK